MPSHWQDEAYSGPHRDPAAVEAMDGERLDALLTDAYWAGADREADLRNGGKHDPEAVVAGLLARWSAR